MVQRGDGLHVEQSLQREGKLVGVPTEPRRPDDEEPGVHHTVYRRWWLLGAGGGGSGRQLDAKALTLELGWLALGIVYLLVLTRALTREPPEMTAITEAE